ncbi:MULTISPECIES: hypothetical protein [Acinetobacter calcoaceticus/baumannii complex]|uniref:hypothetical protein n=1 Tax=Acinetobacter calcoaceticus/baumannii complex TaxID=909768 RepID=UPI002940C121|nr:hypothetical protein [Acinetobacter baumannii]MDV4328435.1 hypothetical protein [Acinetobacter baumannii]MDV4331799.1 hypothetical protein [Acinetobacter baumannii]
MNIESFLIKCIINDSFKYFKKLELYKKLYFIGFFLFIIFLPFRDNIFSNFFLMVSFSVIELGFISWIYIIYKKRIKGIKIYNSSFWLINIIIIWLSNVISQNLITASLGLPATDFYLTLGLWTFFCYVPALLIIILIIGLIIYVPTILIWSLKIFLETLYVLIKPLLYIFIKNEPHIRKKSNDFNPLHFSGFMLFILFLAFSIVALAKSESKFYTPIKYTAYYADYHKLNNYPDIDHDHKVVLHANNIYSIAIKNGSKINISVKKIK